MKEDRKIGYLALIIGGISLGEAWINILDGKSGMLDVLFLGMGLIASLIGIALIIQRNNPSIED